MAYIGLDSLTNTTIGSAIGSLLIADLTATIGARYNFASSSSPVTIVIDEAAEALNEPLIALLNKGGGGGARLVLATQTLGDMEARLGSRGQGPAGARQRQQPDRRPGARCQDPAVHRREPAQNPGPGGAAFPGRHLRGRASGRRSPAAIRKAGPGNEAALFAPEWLGLCRIWNTSAPWAAGGSSRPACLSSICLTLRPIRRRPRRWKSCNTATGACYRAASICKTATSLFPRLETSLSHDPGDWIFQLGNTNLSFLQAYGNLGRGRSPAMALTITPFTFVWLCHDLFKITNL